MMSYLTKLRAQKKGFTLIELIVVIAIIGVLMAILVPSMIGWVNSSRRRTAEANARTIYQNANLVLQDLDNENAAPADGDYTSAGTDPFETAIGASLDNLDGTWKVKVDGGMVTAAEWVKQGAESSRDETKGEVGKWPKAASSTP